MRLAPRTFGHRGSRTQIQPAPLAVGRARLARPAARVGGACNYEEAAALFERTTSGLRYRRFASAALALRYANEEMNPRRRLSSTMEVGDARYAGDELQALYSASRYPLRRSSSAS